jgi:hypothetical protein
LVTFVEATQVAPETFQEVNKFSTKKTELTVIMSAVPAGMVVRIEVNVESPDWNRFC